MKLSDRFWKFIWKFMERKTLEELEKKESPYTDIESNLLALCFFLLALFLLVVGDSEIFVGREIDLVLRLIVMAAGSTFVFLLTEGDGWKTTIAALILVFFV
jgi:hypothetical protein